MIESAPNSGLPLDGINKPETSLSMEEFNATGATESQEYDSLKERTISK